MTIKRKFTLIEILVVIMIIGILLGMLLPVLSKAKARARYVRWRGFSSMINRDADAIINYDFETMDYKVKRGAVMSPAVYNAANSCTAAEFNPADYAGIISPVGVGPTWLRGGGRWAKQKNALQFDGVNDYLEIFGTKLTNFNPSRHESNDGWSCL